MAGGAVTNVERVKLLADAAKPGPAVYAVWLTLAIRLDQLGVQ